MEHPQNNAYSAILKTARELVLSLNDDINSITGAGVETGDGEQVSYFLSLPFSFFPFLTPHP